ncbi:MAG TPA: type I methionyl aminopeptidase [Candidatus Paceibacterota bacterium]
MPRETIHLKTPEEIEIMAKGGRMLAKVIDEIKHNARVGVSLEKLDRLAFRLIKEFGAEPAFLGYCPEGAEKAYPATICASLNNVVVHGVPDKKILKSGDVLKLDLGLRYRGLCVDAAVTVGIGEVSSGAKKMMEVTQTALAFAIEVAKPGKRIGDIGYTIEKYVTKNGLKVIRGLTGHGIGKKLHEEPVVFNFGSLGRGLKLQPGLTIAIEPMTSMGSPDIVQLKDESYATSDGSLSAQFEHTIAITEDGARILTLL